MLGLEQGFIELDGADSYNELLEWVLTESTAVEIRGQSWREVRPPALAAVPMSATFFKVLRSNFSTYLADGRVDYIASKIDWDAIVNAVNEDINSRQLVVYKPDWYWDGKWEHVNCIIAYQFEIRKGVPILHVFMRSSDIYNAFMYDWYAASCHLSIFKELTGCKKNTTGHIYWHISNMHIRSEDIGAIKEQCQM